MGKLVAIPPYSEAMVAVTLTIRKLTESAPVVSLFPLVFLQHTSNAH